MIMFKFDKISHPENIINPLADIFERIYEGKAASRGGKHLKKTPSSRAKVRKAKRVKSADEPRGSSGKRKASSTEQRKKKKKTSQALNCLEN